ncbi:eukaryotic initiation factor 4A-II [Copidosoma floridanum]|uniref:eukaryotic initiation factor 4A-II n=1 Tax=Copidosoma floridanum TaxID=29053 RepID=UPI0006C96C0C|nr:eukaryotic initiation factor 4A-II [Copidosoma floridanum]
MLQRIDTNLNECQALILTPIDESVMQIQKIITILGIYTGTRCYAFPTDLNISDDISLLEQDATPHIIIGTPNSILDMINRGAFSTEHINMFVLDEADEMLFPRFKYPIYNVLMTLPPNVQVILVSNTMSTEAMEESLCLVRKPIQIVVERKELTFENVKQYYVVVKREVWKFSTLLDLSKTMTSLKVIVYCNTREKVDWLTCNLDRQNFCLPITAIHGGMDQEERDHRMRLFNGGSKSVIITTDIISDIDFLIISLVINYDLPLNCENYIRRIRPDFKRYCNNPRGVISLVTANEKKILKDFGKTYNMRNEEMPSSLNFRAESPK